MSLMIARKYASSLFELAIGENKADKILEQIFEVKNVVLQNNNLFKVLIAPNIVQSDKLNIVSQLFNKDFDEYVLNFVKLLIEKKRFNLFSNIADCFKDQYNEYFKIEEVLVISACELSVEQEEKLSTKLARMLGKQISITTEIDKDIIGGIIVKTNDKIIDGSIKSRMNGVKAMLENSVV